MDEPADKSEKAKAKKDTELCEPKASPAPAAKKKAAGKTLSSGGRPKASRPAASGKAQPNPPAPAATAPNPTVTTAENSTEVMSRIGKLESMFEKMIETLSTPHHEEQHANTPRDCFSEYGDCDTQRGSSSPPVIELADNRSVADFLSANRDDAVSLFSDVGLQEADKDKRPEFKIPRMAQKFVAPSGIGEPLDEDVADTIVYMMGQKLDQKSLDEAATRYPCPSNCTCLETPKVNSTIWENISTGTRHRDLKLQMIQSSLLKGINAFARTLPATLSEAQQDAMAFLCDANFSLNCMRKDSIKPDMNSNFHHLCKPSHKVTKYLFGDDLGRQVKEIQEQRKTMSGMMKSRFTREQSRFQPYKKPDVTSRRQYTSTGFTRPLGRGYDRRTSHSNPMAGSSAQPFLGKAWRGRPRDPPHTYTPTAAREGGNKQPTYHRQSQSQGRK
ncbi:uncharacterized protein [Diadema antillarum]|uniref:uncharacterized protein n=1 Tax=Diadema antillarum TaxID=105358 RepID=UPI003A84B10C